MSLHSPVRRRWRTPLLATLVGALTVACFPAAVRADKLDDALRIEGHKILRALKERGYKYVGVLPFGLKRPEKKDLLYNAGPINKNMPEYLECALVRCSPTKNPTVTVLRDTTKEALKHFKNLDPNIPMDRKKLLELSCKTWAWDDSGAQPVRPDALLFGYVELKPGYKECEVTILAFDNREISKNRAIHTFRFAADRFLLADSGIGYSLSRNRKGDAPFADFDDLPNLTPTPGGAQKPAPTTNPASGGFPVELKLFYKRNIQAMTPEGGPPSIDRRETYNVGQPTDGEVTIVVKNVTTNKVGIKLLVGGLSTLNDPSLDANDGAGKPPGSTQGSTNELDADMWVLTPGVEYTLRGFYLYKQLGESSVYPFRVVADSQSNSLFQAQGEALHQILLHVYRPATQEAVMKISERGRKLSYRQPVSVRRKMVGGKNLAEALGAQVPSRRSFIGSDTTKEKTTLEPDTLGNVALTDTMIINLMPAVSATP